MKKGNESESIIYCEAKPHSNWFVYCSCMIKIRFSSRAFICISHFIFYTFLYIHIFASWNFWIFFASNYWEKLNLLISEHALSIIWNCNNCNCWADSEASSETSVIIIEMVWKTGLESGPSELKRLHETQVSPTTLEAKGSPSE